ncbi:TIGR02594, TIGR02594 family protein [uncultured Caudovirales phage]|uniref:TIGR02594, TIGR02594 family protein n=1 Tax=uncultured Caudovirales phage TaxID=2100421 RepID=A0A6J5MCC9_9CAUD|nr:TIGR02594, TIGR02594 family protein [uncultured Caudovirales phage]
MSHNFSWYEVARRELGVKELQGIADNPRIVEYHATTTLRATDDEVPWCSSFVNWCMTKAGYVGTRSAAARSWASWGVKIDKPVKGCIVVLTRTGGGHVGFYEDGDDHTISVLGGNQDDAVNVRKYRSSRLLAYVLPVKMNDKDQLAYELMKAKV